MSVYEDTEFDLSEMEVVWKGIRCRLTVAQGTIFHNMLKAEGWISIPDMLTTLNGDKIQSTDPVGLASTHLTHIRRALRYREIPITIENQKTSFWISPAYRLIY
jgi:hypothetical protein